MITNFRTIEPGIFPAYDVESSEKSEKREESTLREEGSWFV